MTGGASAAPVAGALIDGRLHRDGPLAPVHDPARPADVVGWVVCGDEAMVERAVGAAVAAAPGWASTALDERARLLDQAAGLLEADIEERARHYVRENGKTLAEARGELAGLPGRLRMILGWAHALADEVVSQQPSVTLRRRPYGPTVCVAPFNAPLTQAMPQVFSALLAGNTVVVKPPLSCPQTLLDAVVAVAGVLPPGVLNGLTGADDVVAAPLVRHPAVRKVAFTGSTATGSAVLQAAAPTIKSVTLELGGNDAAIVLRDADLSPAAVAALAGSVFRMSGQVCMAVKRLYVEDAIHDQLVEALSAELQQVVVGHGLRAGVTMGPLHSRAGREKVQGLVNRAMADGARVQTLGTTQLDEGDDGWFLLPQLVTDLDPSAALVTEEQFGPVLPVLRCADAAQAIAMANEGPYGLSGSVWTADAVRGAALAAQLDVGVAFVNVHGTQSVNRTNAPYGGSKHSGLGRKAGRQGLEEYAQIQTLVVPGGQ